MKKKHVLIAGGGAAGLTAGIFAAREGAAVTILEQNEKPGKKLCATGNGKCNLTNLNMPADAYRGTHPEFAKEVLNRFSVSDTIAFFSRLGIYTTNRNQYLYPRSQQAQSVVDVLVMECQSLGVKIKTNEQVAKIIPGGAKKGASFQVLTKTWHYECDALILANGSRASSISGSDGSGYLLAEGLGHRIIKPLPALTALKCAGTHFRGWAGVRTEGRVTLCINGIPLKTEQGELQLTEYGVSGIPVFQLSRYAVRALCEKCSVSLKIDFFPDFSLEEWEAFLGRRKKDCPYKNKKELLVGLFPEKLIRVLCAQKNLTEAVKAFGLQVTDSLPFEQAQVCSGGVDTAQVRETTMESRIVPGLYFAGELLDIDGTCGGYNLQWAWSSGAVAGASAGTDKDRREP